MPGDPDPLYVRARAALLDALVALEPHIDALVLVGAQAIYLHTGDADLAVAEYTTDADFGVGPDDLADSPILGDLLTAHGFAPRERPGGWLSPDGIYVDLENWGQVLHSTAQTVPELLEVHHQLWSRHIAPVHHRRHEERYDRRRVRRRRLARRSRRAGPRRADRAPPDCSGSVVSAEVDGDSSILVFEHGDELQAGAERVEVLAKS